MHDLAGLTVARCPECGRGFDPADHTTTLASAIPEWRRSLILKHGVRLAILLLVIVGFKTTAFPRPARLDDWRLWLWFGRPIGVMSLRHGDHTIYAHYWFGDELRREAYRADNHRLAWSIEDRGGHRYRLRALEADISSNALLSAFNSIKGSERFFGVRIGRPERAASVAPFAIEGDEVEVFSMLMRQFAFPITPFRLTESQRHVWTWDRERQRMVAIDVTAENASEFPVDDRDPTRVLIPKPR